MIDCTFPITYPWSLVYLIGNVFMSACSSFKCNFACKQCEESPAKNPSVKLHLDHIIPWNKGGETTFEPHQLNNKPNTTNKWLKTHYGAVENTFVHLKVFS